MTTDPYIAVDPDVVLVRVDGTTVAYVPARRELFELTPAATEFVASVREDDLFDLPDGLVEELAGQLREIGVLTDAPRSEADRRAATPDTTTSIGPGPGDPPPDLDGRVLGPYAALNHRFTVTVDDSILANELSRVLAGLTIDDTVPTAWSYTVASTGDRPGLWAGDERLDVHPSRAGMLGTLLWDLNRRAVAASDAHLLLHAGAVVDDDGTAVVLPAAMEAGKTTLVTALVAAGMDYLSDELAALPTPWDRVLAYPKALALDPGSWPLFSDLEPPETQRRLSPNQWLLTTDQVRPGARHGGEAPLGLLVFPRHGRGAATESRGLRPVEALRHLAECAFGFRDHPGKVLPRLARVAESVPAHHLTIGDGVDVAVNVVAELIDLAAAARS